MRKQTQKLKIWSAASLVIVTSLVVPLSLSQLGFAAPGAGTTGSSAQGTDTASGDNCTGKNVGTDSCSAAIKGGDCKNLSKCDLLSQYINPLIKVLAALVGVVVVISIIIGGIQYSSSAGDPQAATAAKNRIRNAIIALVVFIFLYALLNFLIPGGLG